MTILKRAEVDALGHLYFLQEAGRATLTYEGLLSHIDYRAPQGKAREYLTNLLGLGFVEAEGDGELAKRPMRVTPVGLAWFEANVDGWRDCNQYNIRPRFEAKTDEPIATLSVAARLRDPLVTGAALCGAAFGVFLTWIVR